MTNHRNLPAATADIAAAASSRCKGRSRCDALLDGQGPVGRGSKLRQVSRAGPFVGNNEGRLGMPRAFDDTLLQHRIPSSTQESPRRKTTLIAALAVAALAPGALAPAAHAQGVIAPLAQPSPTIATGSPGQVVNTPRGPEVSAGGTRSYEQLSGPGGGGIMTPNSNGTSTIIAPSGATQTVPTPR